MKRLATLLVSLLGLIVLAGCASTDQRLRAMQASNTALNQDVLAKTSQIKALSEEKDRLTKELNYSTRRGDVLMKEKAARLDEGSKLRRGIREFTEQIQVSLQAYYQRTEIVDYLGSELIDRASTDSKKNVLLVDRSNPVPEKGTIIGGRAWLSGPTRLCYCLLRQDKASGKYRVASLTSELTSVQSGMQNWVFELPMSARRGDLIGVYVIDTVTIPYDDVDTGNVVSFSGDVKMNSSINMLSGDIRNKRTYSFGVVGYFDSPVAISSEILNSADIPIEDILK